MPMRTCNPLSLLLTKQQSHDAGENANAATRVITRKHQTPSTPPKQTKSVEDWMQDDTAKTNVSDDEMGLFSSADR